jgi:hypothetical protein
MTTVQPDPWLNIATELHKLADDALALVGEPAPSCFDISIQPRPWNNDEAAPAVDVIAAALLGKPGETKKMTSGVYHRDASGSRGPIGVAVYRQMPAPDERDEEIAQLRARVAELESRDAQGFSRSDEDPTPPGARMEAHTVAVTDDGLVDETPAASIDPDSSMEAHYDAETEAGIFSSARRQELLWKRSVGSFGSRTAALADAHSWALLEDNDWATARVKAWMTPADEGRVANPNLARFMAVREDRTRRRGESASAE